MCFVLVKTILDLVIYKFPSLSALTRWKFTVFPSPTESNQERAPSGTQAGRGPTSCDVQLISQLEWRPLLHRGEGVAGSQEGGFCGLTLHSVYITSTHIPLVRTQPQGSLPCVGLRNVVPAAKPLPAMTGSTLWTGNMTRGVSAKWE